MMGIRGGTKAPGISGMRRLRKNAGNPAGKGSEAVNSAGSVLRDFFKKGDMLLLSLCCGSTLYGILLIASATHSTGSLRYVIIQAAALVLGVFLFAFFTFLDLDPILERWRWIFLFNVIFIASLFVFGVEGGTGNRSWLRPSWFPVGIQPAEVVKITFILLMARQMSYLKSWGISSPGSVFQMGAHVLFMAGLIYAASKDAGMVLVYLFIFLAMAFAAGVKLRWFILAFAAGGGGFAAAWIKGWIPEYMRNRILVIFDHSLDPLGIGWQQNRSVLALGSGGLTGQGLFHGTQTQKASTTALPAKHTDFIFSVAGEELGMIGCVLIIILLAAVVIRCIYVAVNAKDDFSALICVGIAGMLIFQIVENIGMCLFLTPVIGLTLPFFSYGGTSIVSLFAAMGIISGVKMRSLPRWLRGRNDRR
ncbi:rod shape determining protein RodA [Papillibacter cinnamivorans DSM 12816]|uniref:Rod shape determining protein RodA n=1 Tax=Papillibacter cinnamivorans DSM 12816 TaxID=1122930 RepID=A0A1W1YIR2_9FIRM|nr:rod shape determining protein RodA [Papillibacter cinnamivorans DSM 12816]